MTIKEPGPRLFFCRQPPKEEPLGAGAFPMVDIMLLLSHPQQAQQPLYPREDGKIDIASIISSLELQRLSLLSVDEKTATVACLLVQPLTAHTQPEFPQDIPESQDYPLEVENRSYGA